MQGGSFVEGASDKASKSCHPLSLSRSWRSVPGWHRLNPVWTSRPNQRRERKNSWGHLHSLSPKVNDSQPCRLQWRWGGGVRQDQGPPYCTVLKDCVRQGLTVSCKVDLFAEVRHLALRVDGSPRESLEPLDGAVLFWNTVENARVPGFFGLPQ